jgi:hypothetical protein
MNAPPWPHQPTVEWQVCGDCNYDCGYCIQARAHRRGQPDRALLEAILDFLASLPGPWEIKMTGGEPFASRHFLDFLVPALLARTPHTVSLLTNLSAGPAALDQFARLTRGRLGIVSASLHLDFTTVESFLARLRRLREAAGPGARFVVNSVLAPDRLPALAAARVAVEAAGFRFYPQLMKVKGGLHPYTPEQRAALADIVGDWAVAEAERTANFAPSYQGRRCWAGARYLVLTQSGEAWSCRTAKRHGQGRLGRVGDGRVAWLASPAPCPYPICPCAVPANRGMIEGVPARLAEAPGEP